MGSPGENRGVSAARIITFVSDLITGGMVLAEYALEHRRDRLTLEQIVAIRKMCLSHLVLTHAKFEESWKRYHDLVTTEHRDACKPVLKTFRVRKVTDFRNRCVGHIWDTGRRRLAHSEVMDDRARIAEPNLTEFLNWTNNPKANMHPTTVVSVVEALPDSLASAHSVQPTEVANR